MKQIQKWNIENQPPSNYIQKRKFSFHENATNSIFNVQQKIRKQIEDTGITKRKYQCEQLPKLQTELSCFEDKNTYQQIINKNKYPDNLPNQLRKKQEAENDDEHLIFQTSIQSSEDLCFTDLLQKRNPHLTEIDAISLQYQLMGHNLKSNQLGNMKWFSTKKVEDLRQYTANRYKQHIVSKKKRFKPSKEQVTNISHNYQISKDLQENKKVTRYSYHI